MIWCPGHVDIGGNEIVDELAKQAANDPVAEVFHTRGNKNKIARVVLRGGALPRHAPLPLPRHTVSLIYQLAAGHCPLNFFLYRIRQRTDPLCSLCRLKESVEHYLDHCAAFRIPRRSLRKELRSSGLKFNPNRLSRLLMVPRAHPALARFIVASRRFQFAP